MTDYYSVMLSMIAEIDAKTPRLRQLLYERAYVALISELVNSRPLPSALQIDTESQHLGGACRRIENEFVYGYDERAFDGSKNILLKALERPTVKIEGPVSDSSRLVRTLVDRLTAEAL